MADNTQITQGNAAGDIISSDQITSLNGNAVATGEKVQRVKMGFGTDNSLRDVDAANPLPTFINAQSGAWGYSAGISGTLTLTSGKKVLRITAIALEVAASFTINGGDSIIIPYGATDKVSSSIEFQPLGNLVNPVIIFTNTKAYLVEYVT